METAIRHTTERRYLVLSLLAAVVGACLVVDAARSSSATYDESVYIQIGCRWWRTGDQERITRMGSPLTFWKLQQAPTLWALDRSGRGHLIDDPVEHEPRLLVLLRIGTSWIWLAGLGITALWARRLYGPTAMAFASWIYALSPNLIAHGALLTMEMPIIAACGAVGFCFGRFLNSRNRSAFAGAAIVAGLAFSCKFTAILIPPICGALWWIQAISRRENSIVRTSIRVVVGMGLFCLLMIAADFFVTGFATLPLSERTGLHPSLAGHAGFLRKLVEIPLPQDWVGFVTQLRHQRSGGPSYLFGETRMTGWWYYYPVALFVKIPPIFWFLVLLRVWYGWRRDLLLPLSIGLFLAITIVGSSRNYGVRYLLPMSTPAIVWLSGLAEGSRLMKRVALVGVLGYAVSSLSTHPRELSYFPSFVGGPEGGRRILADSNLDWGQGLHDLARLQSDRSEFQDMTLYYFGETKPHCYSVVGTVHVIDASDRHPTLPARLSASTRFVAVSASLQFGPWGPTGYFERLRPVRPVAHTPDWTISIYEWGDQ